MQRLSRLLDHTNIQTTERYLRAFQAEDARTNRRRALDGLYSLGKGPTPWRMRGKIVQVRQDDRTTGVGLRSGSPLHLPL